MGPVNQSVTLGHITSQTARPLRADKSQVRQHLSCPRPPWCRRRKRHWTWRVVGGGCWRCRRTQRHVEPIRATVRCRRRRAGSGRHVTLNSAAAAAAASTETPDKHRQSAVRYNVCVQNVVVGAPALRRRSADVAIIPCILLIEKCTGEVSQSYVSLRHRDAPLSENQHAPETGDKPMTLIRGSVGGGEFTQAGGEIGTDNQSSNVPTEVEEIQGERELCRSVCSNDLLRTAYDKRDILRRRTERVDCAARVYCRVANSHRLEQKNALRQYFHSVQPTHDSHHILSYRQQTTCIKNTAIDRQLICNYHSPPCSL